MTEGEALSVADRVRFFTGGSPMEAGDAVRALRVYIDLVESEQPGIVAARDALTSMIDETAPRLAKAKEALTALTPRQSS